MKKYIFLVFLFPLLASAQNNDKLIEYMNTYSDSVDNLILSSSGTAGEILCNSIKTVRNIRAIGMQETKISFYYFQKDDSVYEDTDGSVYFYPQYNPPVKIEAEYNIAASQQVRVSYYKYGESYLYKSGSTGAYGDVYKTYWISNEDILKYTEKNHDNTIDITEYGKFSKEVYSDGLLVMDKIKLYLKLYYDILNIEYIDK